MREEDITVAGKAPVLYAIGSPAARRDQNLNPAYVLEISGGKALVIRSYYGLRYQREIFEIPNVELAGGYTVEDVKKRQNAFAKAAAAHPNDYNERRKASEKALKRLKDIPDKWRLEHITLASIQMEWPAWEAELQKRWDREEAKRLADEKERQNNEQRGMRAVKALRKAGIPGLEKFNESSVRWGKIDLPLDTLEAIVEKLG